MNTQIITKYGEIKGIKINGVYRFCGLPFAKPPVGERRFKAPQSPDKWNGVRDATRFLKNPIQVTKDKNFDNLSEDCLFLNIWVPDVEKKLPLPVMVWIHGGSYATGGTGGCDGSGNNTFYDGEILARDTGCIIVTFNYRLNFFGFLSLADYLPDFEENLGLRDQLAALKWVHDTISSFGGDQGNVTIFGQSAGAACITALLLVPEAAPFFHKAIAQSNCLESFYTPEEGKEIAEQFFLYAGIEKKQKENLFNLSYSELMAASVKLDQYVSEHYLGRCSFCPVVDGKFLTDHPSTAEYKGIGKPLLIGTNHHEANLFLHYAKKNDFKKPTITDRMLHQIDKKHRTELFQQYQGYPSRETCGEIVTDVMYVIPLIRLAERYSRQNDVYVYRMDYYTLALKLMGFKACHINEIPLLFGNISKEYEFLLKLGKSKQSKAIGSRMRQYWGSFARTGVPVSENMQKWESYNEKHRMTMIFNKNDELISDPEKKKREMYKKIDTLLIETN